MINVLITQDQYFDAVYKGDAATIAFMLESGNSQITVDILSPSGLTALIIAAGEGHSDVVEVLIAHKASFNATDLVSYIIV